MKSIFSGSPATASVSSLSVLSFSEGSVIAAMSASFPINSSVPNVTNIMDAVASGSSNFSVDASSLIVEGTCMNQFICLTLFEFPPERRTHLQTPCFHSLFLNHQFELLPPCSNHQPRDSLLTIVIPCIYILLNIGFLSAETYNKNRLYGVTTCRMAPSTNIG